MILITGASGLVGGHLAWHLLQKNEQILAIKRPTTNLKPLKTIFSFYTNEPEKYLKRIVWRTADVLEPESLLSAFESVKTLYHCAAIVSLGSGSSNLIETNVNGTRNIIHAALKSGVEKLCFVSSIAACGSATGKQLISETIELTNVNSKSAYAQSKYLSEQEVRKGINAGLNAVIVNPGIILGVSGTHSGSSELFARVKKGLPFYTNGGSGYVDVRDVVQIMIKLTENSIFNERYILVSENCSNKDILTWMAIGYGKNKPFIGIGKIFLFGIGFISEMIGKFAGFKPKIDRSMALAASNRSYYTSEKIIKQFNYTFIPIQKCIFDVCSFDKISKK